MADYSKSKKLSTKVYPERASEVSDLLSRVEPLMTASTFKRRFLKGIPLKMKNGDIITDEDLTDYLKVAMNEAEMNLKVSIDPVQRTDRLPFDKNLYKMFVYTQVQKWPIISVEEMAIVSSDGQMIFSIPNEWLDFNGQSGRIQVISYLAAYGNQVLAGPVSNAGAYFLTTLSGLSWVPSYWNVTYTHGLCNKAGQVPMVVNKYIGLLAAIDLLSMIGPNDDVTSTSLGQDGISQGNSRSGIQRYQARLRELEQERDKLEQKIKGLFRQKYFMSNI